MKYPVLLHSDDGQHFSASVPDVPGCYGAGDSFDEALADVEQALVAHFELLAEDQEAIPVPSSIQKYIVERGNEGGTWALVDMDPTPYMGKAQKINVTLPGFLITRIERELGEHTTFKNRSHFLAEAALRLLSKDGNHEVA